MEQEKNYWENYYLKEAVKQMKLISLDEMIVMV
jgi:hypothetical protein